MRKTLIASAVILGVSVSGCAQSKYTVSSNGTSSAAPTTTTTTWEGPSATTPVPTTTAEAIAPPNTVTVPADVTTTAKAGGTKAPKTSATKATKAPRTTTPKPPKTTTPKPPPTTKAPKPPASVTINNGDPYPNIAPPTKLHIRNMKRGECGLIGGSYSATTGTCYNVNY